MTAERQEEKQMKTFFDHKDYLGEYNENTGVLTVTNAFTDAEVSKQYASKYTAQRGFERIVRKMMANEG